MILIVCFILTLFFLLGTFFLTALGSVFRRFQRKDSKKKLLALNNLFLYRKFNHFFFPEHEFESLFFSIICAQHITRFFYISCAIIFMMMTSLLPRIFFPNPNHLGIDFIGIEIFVGLFAFMLFSFIIGDYLPRILGTKYPEKTITVCAPPASLFLFLAFPLSYIFLSITNKLSRTVYFDQLNEPLTQAKQEIIEIIQDSNLTPVLDLHDKKLIESVLSFRDRIAREVMVPRVDLFCLSADTSIKEAAKLLESEGYSRTPVYRNTVDNIIGVLMYKDVLKCYMDYELKGRDSQILNAPIESIQKNVLYAPETKKISNLLQEFRKKQVHLAIVVDEYGGTEGIVTIEDILEQIVGEIADEYDEEEKLFISQPDGSWIVDARMGILDIEEQLGINVPSDTEYDTIGGYIFHRAGTIPHRGFIIHHDAFDMEILRSTDRSVEKVRIRPLNNKSDKEISSSDN